LQTDHPGEQLAAIDLGSNSFHMVVARVSQGEVRIQESLSEKVQLGGGLDRKNRISDDAMGRALDCLSRFAQRLTGIPRRNVRIVGTNALRQARNARDFMARAEEVLGHDIEVVSGREEARLIYLGVSHALADDAGRRLVVDIGGGSTELIIGERFEALETESLHMGCVSFTQCFFADGSISAKHFDKAVTAVRQEVLSIDANYRRSGWAHAVGASGTIKAIGQVCQENGWSEAGVSLHGLEKIRKKLLRAGHIDKARLKGLRADRAPIFPAGVCILYGVFQQLELTHMDVSTGALREGLLYDQLGRFTHEDVRERTIEAMTRRHHVDQAQAERVANTAERLRCKVASEWGLEDAELQDMLRWAGQLHEVGLAVSHSQFHKHGAYLVTNSDLPGFSHQSQQAMAVLVRGHRRKLPLSMLAELPDDEREPLLRLCLLLRLAVRLHHARRDDPLPTIQVEAGPARLSLAFPDGWLVEHPLTSADLEQEQGYWQAADYELVVQ
jgi:exopolyphosphatase/guanosine-5'-triphosphate,3'-diphosphate pyrophosphatase